MPAGSAALPAIYSVSQRRSYHSQVRFRLLKQHGRRIVATGGATQVVVFRRMLRVAETAIACRSVARHVQNRLHIVTDDEYRARPGGFIRFWPT